MPYDGGTPPCLHGLSSVHWHVLEHHKLVIYAAITGP